MSKQQGSNKNTKPAVDESKKADETKTQKPKADEVKAIKEKSIADEVPAKMHKFL